MTRVLPPKAKAQFDQILSKLLACLAEAKEQTVASSQFMDIDGSVGGQVLASAPPIAHPYQDIHKMYLAMFQQAKEEGLELREVNSQFKRQPDGQWTSTTNWVTRDEHASFVKAAAPVVEELRQSLRKTAAAAAQDWASISLTIELSKPGRVVVLHGKKQRIVAEPGPDLLDLVRKVEAAAAGQGLSFTGATWRVKDQMEDEEGEIDSAMGVIATTPG